MTASASFRWTVPVSQLVDKAARGAVADAAENLLEQANRTAPIEEGTLTRSAVVVTSGTEAAVGYDTPYAVRQHQDTRLRHDRGRRAKWLQKTLIERQTALVAFIGKRIGEVF